VAAGKSHRPRCEVGNLARCRTRQCSANPVERGLWRWSVAQRPALLFVGVLGLRSRSLRQIGLTASSTPLVVEVAGSASSEISSNPRQRVESVQAKALGTKPMVHARSSSRITRWDLRLCAPACRSARCNARSAPPEHSPVARSVEAAQQQDGARASRACAGVVFSEVQQRKPSSRAGRQRVNAMAIGIERHPPTSRECRRCVAGIGAGYGPGGGVSVARMGRA
jgi:hypothetical protein